MAQQHRRDATGSFDYLHTTEDVALGISKGLALLEPVPDVRKIPKAPLNLHNRPGYVVVVLVKQGLQVEHNALAG